MTDPQEATTVASHSPSQGPAHESDWSDEPGYPHRVENHVKVYLHLEPSPDGTYRWAVASETVDGSPLDGTEDGHYCDYTGHPAGARPDWDREHDAADAVPLPTADELLPLLARALGHQVTTFDKAHLRDAGDLIADHSVWRANRDQLSSAEATDEPPSSSAWHDSDDTGCELADRAVALLAAMTEPARTTPPPPTSEPAGVALMRSALSAQHTPSAPSHRTPSPPVKGPTP